MNRIFTALELEQLFSSFLEECNVASNRHVTKSELKSIIETYDKDVISKAKREAKVYTGEEKPVYKSSKNIQEYLHLSDIHLPFHMDKWVKDIIEEHSYKGKVLIVNGDFLDCHDVSSFPKSKAVGLGNEVALAKKLLRDWSCRFDKIYLIAGNHEKRMATYIRKRISPEVVSLVEDDILKNIVDDIKLDNLIYMAGDTTNWYIQIDNVICCHPNDYKRSTSGILHTATFALPYFEAHHPDANVFIMAHCFSSDTELLTEKGWCKYKDLDVGINVATMSKETKEIQFQPIQKKYVYNSFDEILRFKNDTIDHLVTSDHGMVYETRSGYLKYCKAKEWTQPDTFVRVSGIRYKEDNRSWSDNDIRLLVQCVSSGFKHKRKYWSFRLKRGEKASSLRDLFISMCIPFTEKVFKSGNIRFYAEYLEDKFTKDLPDAVMSFSQRQIHILLDEWSNVSGVKCTDNRIRLKTYEERDADILQMLCSISGIKSILFAKGNIFILSITKNTQRARVAIGFNRGSEPYSGDVFCVTVQNGTLLARRNGKVIITQNTHHLGIGIYRSKVVAESGCLCQTQDYAASGNLAYTPQARGYLCWTSTDRNVGFNDIKMTYLG